MTKLRGQDIFQGIPAGSPNRAKVIQDRIAPDVDAMLEAGDYIGAEVKLHRDNMNFPQNKWPLRGGPSLLLPAMSESEVAVYFGADDDGLFVAGVVDTVDGIVVVRWEY